MEFFIPKSHVNTYHHWKTHIELNIGNIEFYIELDLHNIEFQKSGILPNCFKTVLFCWKFWICGIMPFHPSIKLISDSEFVQDKSRFKQWNILECKKRTATTLVLDRQVESHLTQPIELHILTNWESSKLDLQYFPQLLDLRLCAS